MEIHPATVQVVIRHDAFFARAGDPLSQFETLAARTPTGHRLAVEIGDARLIRVTIPCRLKLRGGRTVITDAAGEIVGGQPRPNPVLIKALKTAHRLLAEASGAAIAAPDRSVLQVPPTIPYERNLLRLAFLAPDLQAQILEGRQPAAVTLQQLFKSEIPAAWDDQRRLFSTAG